MANTSVPHPTDLNDDQDNEDNNEEKNEGWNDTAKNGVLAKWVWADGRSM